jgi:hypothetical protein
VQRQHSHLQMPHVSAQRKTFRTPGWNSKGIHKNKCI